jgi:hypothetical protein
MAVEKTALDLTYFDPIAASRTALENTLDRFQQTFESHSKPELRRRLKEKVGKISIVVAPNGIEKKAE